MAVLWLEVDADTIRERVSRRVLCTRCGHTFRLGWQVQGRSSPCPLCAGALQTRHDDDAETLVHRMTQYQEHTEPLIGYYEERGLLHRINGTLTPEEVSARIANVFETTEASKR